MNSLLTSHPPLYLLFLFSYLFQILGLPLTHLIEIHAESNCHCIPVPQWENNCGEGPCENRDHHHHHHHHSEHCGTCSFILTFFNVLISFVIFKFFFLLYSKQFFAPRHFKKLLALINPLIRAPPQSL